MEWLIINIVPLLNTLSVRCFHFPLWQFLTCRQQNRPNQMLFKNYLTQLYQSSNDHECEQMSHHTGNPSKTLTHTVSGCFHLGLLVLLHFSVFLDWLSTVTSTYGLGPNQFFLFSLSFADSTETRRNRKGIM